jgi:hypothetical protein
MLGLLVGIFAGCGLALLAEMSDNTLHSERDLAFATSSMVLASMPYVLDSKQKARESKKRWMIAATTCVSFAAVLLLAYLQRSAIVTGFGWRL